MSKRSDMFGVTLEELAQLQETKDIKLLERLGGIKGLVEKLQSDLARGLPVQEGESHFRDRRACFGTNVFPSPPGKTLLDLMWAAMKDTTLIILMVSAVVSLFLGVTIEKEQGGWIEGVAILVAVVIVVMVTSLNDYSKEQQFRRLNAVRADKLIKVVREGEVHQVSINDLNVGEIVKLDTGDMIPADGVCIEAFNLRCDESAMTGESDVITKSATAPFLIGGCQVLEGVGSMILTAVGLRSERGKIKALMTQPAQETPLQEKLEKVSEAIGKVGFSVALLTLLVLLGKWLADFYLNERVWHWDMATDLVKMVTTSITIVVVAVPEGLPLAVTISLAYSMVKMLKDQNLVRKLEACETMGGATNICSDKTGTLTENRMTVVKGFLAGRMFDKVPEPSALPKEFITLLADGIALNATANASQGENGVWEFVGSKTECALLVLADKLGVKYMDVRRGGHVDEVFPFSSSKKRMSTVVALPDQSKRIYTKGASEMVLALCTSIVNADGSISPLTAERREEMMHDVIEKMAGEALRTIGLAFRDLPPEGYASPDDAEKDLVLIGIVGIEDPVRHEVPHAVAQCQRAGITVRMVTGDNVITARKIAQNCGILTDGIAMEGPEFRSMSVAARDKILPKLQVLARSTPQDKYILVNRLRELGEVVAVTGDGTNDGPALKEADVGFSMGIAGTEVAKEASDIVLMDDNFTSIVKAVMWGRNVYDSIRKFLQFQLTVNLVAIVVTFVGAVTSGESPLTPVQMLWVNLIMDTFGALALATEPPVPELLERVPYGRRDHLVSKNMWFNIIGQGLYQLCILFTLMYLGSPLLGLEKHGAVHNTMIFNTFVICQVFNEVNSRKLTSDLNVFSGFFQNYVFLGIVVFTVCAQYFIVEFGGSFTATYPLSQEQWLACVAMGAGSIPIGLVIRLLIRPRIVIEKEKKVELDPLVVRALWAKVRAVSVFVDVHDMVRERRHEKMQRAVKKISLMRAFRRPLTNPALGVMIGKKNA